jgi:hypothetical protein
MQTTLSDIVKYATLQIYNSSDFLITQESLNIKKKEHKISLSGFINGTYTVVLLTNGAPADLKQLIKQ